MVIWLAIVVLVLIIRSFLWLCGAVFGSSTSNYATTYADPSHGAFDVLIYQASPYGGGTWTFCRRHADYYSTIQDIHYLQSSGFLATFVQR